MCGGVYECLWRLEENIRTPATGIKNGHDPPNVGAGKQTRSVLNL